MDNTTGLYNLQGLSQKQGQINVKQNYKKSSLTGAAPKAS